LIKYISTTTWSNLIKIFYLACIYLYNLNKKIFIKFDQVVVEISLVKVLVNIWAQLLFDRRFLKIPQDFDQRYLCNHLTKFDEIFFIWIVKIYKIQIKKIIKFDQVVSEISLVKVLVKT